MRNTAWTDLTNREVCGGNMHSRSSPEVHNHSSHAQEVTCSSCNAVGRKSERVDLNLPNRETLGWVGIASIVSMVIRG